MAGRDRQARRRRLVRARLLRAAHGAFAGDPRLGIASGICQELDGRGMAPPARDARPCPRRDARLPRHVPAGRAPARGAPGLGRDRPIKAQIGGWGRRRCPTSRSATTAPWAARRRTAARADQGDAAYYMGYRFCYLLARALFRARREPAALAMLGGYARAAAGRRPRCADPAVRRHLRAEQRLGRLPLRLREALGRSTRPRPRAAAARRRQPEQRVEQERALDERERVVGQHESRTR